MLSLNPDYPTHIRHLMIGQVKEVMAAIITDHMQTSTLHKSECEALKKLRHHPLQDNATDDPRTTLSSKRVQTFILLTALKDFFEGLSTDQFHFFMSQSTLLEYKATFNLRQSSIPQFFIRRDQFIRDTNGLYGIVEDRADLFNLIIVCMKSCVREPKDNEISFAHWKDHSLSMDNDEDTPLSETKAWKRIKRPVNDKQKLVSLKRKGNSMHLQNQILTDYTGSSTSVQSIAENDDDNDSSWESSDDSSEEDDSDDTQSANEQVSDVVDVFKNVSN